MPDPVLQLKAVCAAAGASALVVLAAALARRPAGTSRMDRACVVAMGLGLALGFRMLQLPLVWPPASGLDRLLSIVMPAAIVIELIANSRHVPRWLAWSMRLGLAAAIGRILLHGSVYLAGSPGQWTSFEAGLALAVGGALLAAQWALSNRLSERGRGVSISLALAMAGLCGGMAVMMAGYVTGGEAAVPLAAALTGTATAVKLVSRLHKGPSGNPQSSGTQGAVGIGVVGLFGLLFVGRFFGGLTTGRALTVFFAPLACWATELSMLRGRKPWQVRTLRLVLVAVPLVVVLALAKRDFDRDMMPLLAP